MCTHTGICFGTGSWVGICAAISACVIGFASVVRVIYNLVYPKSRVYLRQVVAPISTSINKQAAISACVKESLEKTCPRKMSKSRQNGMLAIVQPRSTMCRLFTMLVFLSMGRVGMGTVGGDRGVGSRSVLGQINTKLPALSPPLNKCTNRFWKRLWKAIC